MATIPISSVTVVEPETWQNPKAGLMETTNEISHLDRLTMEVMAMALDHVILAAMAPTPVQVTHRIVMGEMVNTVVMVEITIGVTARILIIAVARVGTGTVISNSSNSNDASLINKQKFTVYNRFLRT